MADPNPAPLLNGFSDALPLLLAGLGVLVALDCASRIASRPRPHALLWALGASLSFAILGWALHILRTGALNPSLVIGYHPVLLMAALALGIMGSLPAWWLLFADPGSRKRVLAGAALLSLMFLAAQSIALLAPGFVPGLAWHGAGQAWPWHGLY
ncbi:MAG: hypothetical protein LRY31_05400 [Burkholderiaceae bacterium]|nr:hypothetical protein [Burkholderiaceae bacterium]